MKAPVIKKRITKGKCSAYGCQKQTTQTLCASCRSKKSRAADPVRYSYNNKKNRAKQRKIFFDLTLDEFREFCYETDYIMKTGKTIGCYDVDRKIEGTLPGYTRSNIQILEKTKNIRKWLDYNWQTKEARVVTNKPVQQFENLPF